MRSATCDITGIYFLTITSSNQEQRPNRIATGRVTTNEDNLRGPCVDCTISADVSEVRDRDGLTNTTFNYQWLADDSEITGATSSSYLVTVAELGKTLKVRVSFNDDRDTKETMTSRATKVVKRLNRAPIGKPVILGKAEVGQTLRADVSGISDPNGLTNATFKYEWVNIRYRGISSTDDDEYTLVSGDEGHNGIRLWVTYTDDDGHDEFVESEPLGEVAPHPNRASTCAPVITGMSQVGQTLTADTSGIATTTTAWPTSHTATSGFKERRKHRYADIGAATEQHLHAGGPRRGQDHQGESELHRRRGQLRDVDQHGNRFGGSQAQFRGRHW